MANVVFDTDGRKKFDPIFTSMDMPTTLSTSTGSNQEPLMMNMITSKTMATEIYRYGARATSLLRFSTTGE